MEALALRSSATAMVECVDGQTSFDEAFGDLDVLTAVRVEPVRDHHDAVRLAARMPRAGEDGEATDALEGLFAGCGSSLDVRYDFQSGLHGPIPLCSTVWIDGV